MKSLHDALQDAKNQTLQLKDEKLKSQLINYINQAIEYQNKSECWEIKTLSGAPISPDEPIAYQFTVNEIPDEQSKNFGKRFQMSIGVDKNGIFSFDYMLQGTHAGHKHDFNKWRELKNQSAINQFKNRKQIKELEQSLFNDPLHYVFNGEIANITFASSGGIVATITNTERRYELENGNEHRRWLGLKENPNAESKPLPVTTSLTILVATDENFNNQVVEKSKSIEGQLKVNRILSKRIERLQDGTLKYDEELAESALNETRTKQNPSLYGQLPNSDKSQLNLDMAKYCTEKNQQDNLSK